MPAIDRVNQDLEYVASAVRREDRDDGLPVVYYRWAVLVAIGFALPDLAPRWALPYLWTTTGLVVAASLLLAGFSQRHGQPPPRQ